MKKIFTIELILALSLLTACGNTKESELGALISISQEEVYQKMGNPQETLNEIDVYTINGKSIRISYDENKYVNQINVNGQYVIQQIDFTQTIESQMKENKIKYIGNNSGVGKLLSFLPQFDKSYKQNMFALQTNNEPYGLMIYYEPVENTELESMVESDEMSTYAGYLFNCIENLGYIEFAYRKSPSNNKLEQSEYKILSKIDRP